MKMDGTETNGQYKWSLDADGIRVLGIAGWGSPASLTVQTADNVSTVDGSSFIDAALTTNGTVVNVTPISAATGLSTDPAPKHFWRIDLAETEITGEAINIQGGTYVSVTESI